MKLGIIQDWTQEGFQYAASKGLQAVEYCVNGSYDTVEFCAKVPQLKAYIDQYGVAVGSSTSWRPTASSE